MTVGGSAEVPVVIHLPMQDADDHHSGFGLPVEEHVRADRVFPIVIPDVRAVAAARRISGDKVHGVRKSPGITVRLISTPMLRGVVPYVGKIFPS